MPVSHWRPSRSCGSGEICETSGSEKDPSLLKKESAVRYGTTITSNRPLRLRPTGDQVLPRALATSRDDERVARRERRAHRFIRETGARALEQRGELPGHDAVADRLLQR